MNSLSQIDPRILKMLLMQQGQQRMPQEGMQPPPIPMGDPNMPTDQQQQMDPQMLAQMLGQNKLANPNALSNGQQPDMNMLLALLRQRQAIPTGSPTIATRG